MVPQRTPREIVMRCNAAPEKECGSPDTKQQLPAGGSDILTGTQSKRTRVPERKTLSMAMPIFDEVLQQWNKEQHA